MRRPRGEHLPPPPAWREWVKDVDTLDIARCFVCLGEVQAALADMESAVAAFAGNGDADWLSRTAAAMKHRRRDARSLLGRILQLTLEDARHHPGETSRACLFVAAASALLDPEMLQEVWNAVEALEK